MRGGEGDIRVEVDMDMRVVPRSLACHLLCAESQSVALSAGFVAGNRVRLLFLYVPYSKQSNTNININTGTRHSIAG